jgi:hypothetical protein
MTAPRFITVRLNDTEKAMRNISPLYIQEALVRTAGKVKNVSRLKNGPLLVEVQDEKQLEVVLKATPLGSYPIQDDRHISPNSSRGVVNIDSVEVMLDEESRSARAD